VRTEKQKKKKKKIGNYDREKSPTKPSVQDCSEKKKKAEISVIKPSLPGESPAKEKDKVYPARARSRLTFGKILGASFSEEEVRAEQDGALKKLVTF